MDIPTALGLVTAGISIAGAAYALVRYFMSVVALRRIPDYLSGIYTGYFNQTKTGKLNYDIIEIKKRRSGLFGETIYAHTFMYDYTFTAVKLRTTKNIYKGSWINKHAKSYVGSFQFRVFNNCDDILFEGAWIGPNENEIVKYGDWKLRKTPIQDVSKVFEPRKTDHSIIKKIVKAHEAEPERTIQIKNLTFEIPSGVFDPDKGKISLRLLEKVEEDMGFPDSVLDLGTGCGLYALYYANCGSRHVVASEIEEVALNCAKLNASRNRLENKVTFIRPKESQLYHGIPVDQKFDLIIANLPFTASEYCLQASDSVYHSCFAADRGIYRNLALGAQFHLKDSGFLYFSFAESGYERELHAFLELGNLEYTVVERKIEKDDTFLIYKAKIKESLTSRWSQQY